LGERLLCKQEVVGSIPSGSTISKCWMRNAGYDETAKAKLQSKLIVRLMKYSVPVRGVSRETAKSFTS
jgi:hypothetical protein